MNKIKTALKRIRFNEFRNAIEEKLEVFILIKSNETFDFSSYTTRKEANILPTVLIYFNLQDVYLIFVFSLAVGYYFRWQIILVYYGANLRSQSILMLGLCRGQNAVSKINNYYNY